MMPHKKEYVRYGNEISEYNKKYYQKRKDKLKAKAKRRLAINPNLNKDYYAKNKEKVNALNKRNYERKRRCK